MSWTGNASYYTLCCGGTGCGCSSCSCSQCSNCCLGACGDCFDYIYSIAWPWLTNGSCLRCCSCQNIQALDCDTCLQITDQCSNKSLLARVHDCCTCDEAGCNLNTACGPNQTTPLVDLTTSLFIALDGSLSHGRIPVTVDFGTGCA